MNSQKRWYQHVIERLAWIVFGFLLLAGLIEVISGAVSALTATVSTGLFLFIFVCGLVVFVLQRTRRLNIPWVSMDGQDTRIKKVPSRIWAQWFGSLFFLALVPSYALFQWLRTPTPPTVMLVDFSQDVVDNIPADWLSFGTNNITPTVVYDAGKSSIRQVLAFDGWSWDYTSKILIRDSLTVSPPYTITTKLTYQTDGDSAGIIVGWKNIDDHVAIPANVYTDTIEIWQAIPGKDAVRYNSVRGEFGLIEPQINYWLRVVVRQKEPQQLELEVLWSNDGKKFTPTNAREDLSSSQLSGNVGILTSGPNGPKVYFDDFQVEYFPECSQPNYATMSRFWRWRANCFD